MRSVKLQVVLVLLLVFCSSSAMAFIDTMWLTASIAGGDWSDLSIWETYGGPVPYLPKSDTLVYAGAFNVSPESPLYIPADFTAYAESMYITHTATLNDVVLDIYGSLEMTYTVYFGIIADGGYGEAIINIYPGAYVNIPWFQMYDEAQADPDYEGNVVQTGGLAEIGFFFVNCYDTYKALLDYDLQGGILNMDSILSEDTDNDVLGDYISLDIDGGEWVMPSYWVNRLIVDGAVLASGTAVTPANQASLLYIDDVTYRGAGKLGVSLGSGGPTGDPGDMYTSQWAMDDNAANTTVADSVGGLDGTLNENTSAHHSADAMEGTGSLDFDGNDSVTLPRDSELETGNTVTDALTVAAWIKHDVAAGSEQTVIGTGDGGWYLGTLPGSDTLSFVVDVADPNGNPAFAETAVVTDDTPVFDGQWHHVFAVFDGTSLALYVDDEERATYDSVTGEIQNNNDNGVQIGANPQTGDYWDGLIDDVRIYNFGLTSEDVYHFNYPEYAWNPNYPNGAWWVDPNDAVLEWSAGVGADSHDVYFGKKLRADIARDDQLTTVNIEDLKLLASGWLADADGSGLAEPNDIVDFADFAVLADEWQQTALVFQGNTTDPNFVAATDASPLDAGIWVWRIDEVDDDTSTTYTGRVWGFIISD